MNLSNSEIIFFWIVMTLVGIILLALAYWRWRIRRRYSRERFAFVALRAYIGYLVAAAGLLIGSRSYMLELLSHLLSFLAQSEEAVLPVSIQIDFWKSVVILLIFAILLWGMIYFLYQNWNGVVSTREQDVKAVGQTINIYQDYRYYQKHREKIELYKEKERSVPDVFSDLEVDTRPWYERAANLFSLLDQQYRIDKSEWYGEQNCYLSYYGLDEEKIAILCLEQEPDEERLWRFIHYVQERKGEFKRFIVAIEGEGQKRREEIEGHLLEFRYESELFDRLIPLHGYRRYIENYFEKLETDTREIPLLDMYVPLQGYKIKVEQGKLKKGTELKSTEAYLLDWAKGNRQYTTEHLIVLGNYGQGKTVLMHKIVREMLAHPEEYDRIPILIELRGLSPRNRDMLGIFSRWATLYQAKAEALWELHRAGKLLLILDGFDEMDLVGDTEILFNHFYQIWALAQVPKAQMIVAGRPTLFADDEERRHALGIRSPRIELPYAKAVSLSPLTAKQTEQVLRKVNSDARQGILSALKASAPDSSFAELASRPSTLLQLSIVWSDELEDQKNRLNSASVIGSFIEKTYDRQQSKDQKQKEDVNILTSFERNYFMMGIALGMMLDNGYTNQIKHKDLKNWVRRLWENYPDQLPATPVPMDSSPKENLKIRLRDNSNQLDTILKDVRVGGILVQDLSGRDLLRFAHKSHLEYLVSAFYSAYVLQNKDKKYLLMMVNAIAKAAAFDRSKFQSVADVERFTAELIASSIELEDKQGRALSVEGNKNKYADALFQILIPYTDLRKYFARYMPRLTGWLSLHPDQKYFTWIGLASIVLLLILLGNSNENFENWIEKLCQLLFGVFYLLSILFSRNKKRFVDATMTAYLANMRLYYRAFNILNIDQDLRFSIDYQAILKTQNILGLREIKLVGLSFSVLLAGVGAGAGACVFFASKFMFAFEVGGIAAFVITFILAVAHAVQIAFTVTGAESSVAGIDPVAILVLFLASVLVLFAVSGDVAYALAFTVISVATSVIFYLFRMYKTYQKAIQKVKAEGVRTE